METIGWLGSILLAFCAVPQAILSFREKHSNGISHAFLWMWFVGEILLAIYILPKQDYPLLFNYSVNIACLSIISYYKYRPKNN